MRKFVFLLCLLFFLASCSHSTLAQSLFDRPIQENPYYEEQISYAENFTLEVVQYYAFTCMTETVGIQVPVAEHLRAHVSPFGLYPGHFANMGNRMGYTVQPCHQHR